MYKIIAIALLVSLSGCASSLQIVYLEDGRVDKIIGKGLQDTTVKQGDLEVRMSNKAEPFKDIISLNAMRN